MLSTVPKKDLLILLPYLGKLSLQICTRINRIMKSELSYCNFQVAFQAKCKLINFSHSRNSCFLTFWDCLIFKCGGYTATYYGKSKHHFKVRMCENLRVSALPGKGVKRDNNSAIKEHHLFCNHSSGFDNFSILARNSNDFKVTLMESLLINRDHPPLNKNRHLLPLGLCDD